MQEVGNRGLYQIIVMVIAMAITLQTVTVADGGPYYLLCRFVQLPVFKKDYMHDILVIFSAMSW